MYYNILFLIIVDVAENTIAKNAFSKIAHKLWHILVMYTNCIKNVKKISKFSKIYSQFVNDML